MGDLFQLLQMHKVRADNNQTIQRLDRQQSINTVTELRVRSQGFGDPCHASIGFKNGSHVGVRQQGDIAQVLLSHHAAPDDAVVD